MYINNSFYLSAMNNHLLDRYGFIFCDVSYVCSVITFYLNIFRVSIITSC